MITTNDELRKKPLEERRYDMWIIPVIGNDTSIIISVTDQKSIGQVKREVESIEEVTQVQRKDELLIVTFQDCDLNTRIKLLDKVFPDKIITVGG